MSDRVVKISKFLSLVLRHQPEKIGLRLDEAGWATVTELIEACRAHGVALTVEDLQYVVGANDKKRFSFSDDGPRPLSIRASQGHSVEVALGYEPATPPSRLYHGTAERFLDSIRRQGLLKGKRHQVHLSADAETAAKVGQRHGKPVVLEVQAEQMRQDGFVFYVSANRVWLTNHVPSLYLAF